MFATSTIFIYDSQYNRADMQYRDAGGHNYEISYSQKLQQEVIGQLKASQRLQRRNLKLMMVLIFMFALLAILALISFVYLDQRDAITHLGRIVFCEAYY